MGRGAPLFTPSPPPSRSCCRAKSPRSSKSTMPPPVLLAPPPSCSSSDSSWSMVSIRLLILSSSSSSMSSSASAGRPSLTFRACTRFCRRTVAGAGGSPALVRTLAKRSFFHLRNCFSRSRESSPRAQGASARAPRPASHSCRFSAGVQKWPSSSYSALPRPSTAKPPSRRRCVRCTRKSRNRSSSHRKNPSALGGGVPSVYVLQIINTSSSCSSPSWS
mmetsp:Transcript_49485/g.85061  ORF Transcript_49485/g.85061 Transcript_49485/m.85061 type:complete len:219 (+) Transcript_49485:1460-2116(+)